MSIALHGVKLRHIKIKVWFNLDHFNQKFFGILNLYNFNKISGQIEVHDQIHNLDIKMWILNLSIIYSKIIFGWTLIQIKYSNEFSS
ncbi:hypothetical protein BpHYR1_026231 [Brachionus plicatilis]|uniref:Uncharacterized protein n=1 Tax=Brachionus plicatilis TaxID=10195 RepID=A0A3M7T421_BRAPC|nr:hypothetical protein BpHYR1_026231 [Brachionus plicatilis]